MSQAPAKEKRKSDKDNILVDALYNLVIYLPVLVISWIIDRLDWN